MKKLLMTLVVLAFSSLPALADPLVGLWKTDVDDGAYAYVDIHACDAGFCGTITGTFNADGEYQSPNIGKDIILGMQPAGSGKYAGNVWRPSNGKIYIGKITLSEDRDSLTMKGCVAGGLFCKGSTWTRVQ